MAVVTIPFSELYSWLQAQPANTVDTPYELNITGLTVNDIGNSSIQGTLGNIIRNNSTKYIDLSATNIPSGVTSMTGTFADCTSLVNAPSIPSGVIVMPSAFRNCTSLITAPNIPSSVTEMVETFSGCTSLVIAPTIPNGVTNMKSTFVSCTSLVTAPIIPSSVTNMSGTFASCTSLVTAPDIPSGITGMSETFAGCTSLVTAPIIPSSVIGLSYTFHDCTSLVTAPEIPSGVTSMSGTFQGCTSLTSWRQKNAISLSSYQGCFLDCTNLVNIYSDEPYELKEWLNTIHTASASNFPNDPSTLNYYLYSSPEESSEISINNLNNELATLNANTVDSPFNIKITDLVAGVGDNCYDIRTTLLANPTKYVDLHATIMPDNLIDTYDIYVPCGLFEGCTTLVKGVSFSANSQMQDMTGTYKGCSNLKTLPMIPASTSVMNNTFRDCTSLKLSATDKIVLNDSQQTIQLTSVFNGCTAITTCAEDLIPENADSIPFFFKNCTSLETAPDIPDEVTDIHNLFEGCTALKTASAIPNSVTNMDSAFEGCTSLEDVPNIPSSVTNLTEAFKDCTSLERIERFEVPFSILESAGENCFQNCSSLEYIGVPQPTIEPSDSWHIISLNIGESTVSGKVYDANGNSVTIPSTSITKDTLVLPVLTDEILFPPAVLSEADLETIIQNVISSKYTWWKSTAIDPNNKSFVMYAENPGNFVTNLPISPQGIFDLLHPVGSPYTQLPKTPSPNEMWGSISTWEEIDFGGAFFRTAGGNAGDFENEKTVTAVSGTTLTIPNHGLPANSAAAGSVVYDYINNESRRVVSVSGDNVVVDSAFTDPTKITNVLIGQNDQIQNITGTFGADIATWGVGGSGAFQLDSTPYPTKTAGASSGEYAGLGGAYSFDASRVTRAGTETRSMNLTIKVWKRTN